MKKNTKLKIYLQTIENQQNKLNALQKKKEKLFVTFPKAFYPDSIREPYMKSYHKKEKKIAKIIAITRAKIRRFEKNEKKK